LGQDLSAQNSKRNGTPADALPVTADPSDVRALNAQAERCRRLAGAMYNREVSEILGSMAEGYQRTAEELAKKQQL
jgi:hypothetical protein